MSDQLVLRNARFRVSGHFSDDDYERDHPHVVELAHPPDGFRLVVVEEIMTFHTERGMPIRRGRRQRRQDQQFMRFCFADPAVADAFQLHFGGERIDLECRR